MNQKSVAGMSASPSQSAEKISWDQWYESLQQWTLEKSGYVAPQDQVSMTAWVRDKMNRNAAEVAKALRRLYSEKVQQLQKRQKWNWLFRFLYDVSALEQEVAQLNDVVSSAERHVKDVLPRFLDDFLNTREKQANELARFRHSKRHQRAVRIDSFVQGLPLQLSRYVPRSKMLPLANPGGDLNEEAYFSEMEVWCKKKAPRLRSLWSVYQHVLPISEAADASLSIMSSLGNVLTNTEKSLKEGLGVSGTFTELLRLARWPLSVKADSSFVILWTAIGSCVRYAEMTQGDMSVEATRMETWLCAWWEVSRRWPQSCLTDLGIHKGQLSTGVARIGSSKLETSLGSDILLMICTKGRNGEFCYVMNIQFKRADGNNKILNVERNGWRQFKSLARVETASGNKIKGWYGLLRNQGVGLDSVCALDLPTAVAALDQDLSHIDEQSKTFSFDWTKGAESLSTAIFGTVVKQRSTAFTSMEAAMKAVVDVASHDIKSYVMVQALGYDQIHLNRELARARELTEQREMHFEMGRRLEEDLGLERRNEYERDYDLSR